MPQGKLYSKSPRYTIDSSSLMAMFNDEPWTYKKVTPGLWERVAQLIEDGTIISHAEVLTEIKKDGTKGEELFNWANANRDIFKPHDDNQEGDVIRNMSAKYSLFVNNYGKPSEAHADPWLIAQAVCLKLKIISQETPGGNPTRPKLPNVCADSAFNVKCLDLWQLAIEQAWTFR
jgi:Domain of unknown function (DUF4411)